MVVLDAYALAALLADEPAAEGVGRLIAQGDAAVAARGRRYSASVDSDSMSSLARSRCGLARSRCGHPGSVIISRWAPDLTLESRAKRILNEHRANLLPVVEILGQQAPAAGASRGRHDHAIPI